MYMNNENQKIIGYDSKTGQPIYETQHIQPMNYQQNMNQNFNQQMYVNQNSNIQQTQKPKKKLKWWIPVLLFVAGFLLYIGEFVARSLVFSQNELVLESDILKNPIIMSLRWLAFICWFMVVPSLIIVIVKYVKKTPSEKYQSDIEINNMIHNATSLDEKLLIAFIGDNYQKIIQKKYSIPALFLSWIYTLYRKVYIPSVIGMVVILLLGFLPSTIYIILVLVFAIVLGMNFNKWYITYAQSQVQKIKNANPNASETELTDICTKKGGTNIWIAIVIYIIFVIVSNTLSK